MTFYDRLKTLVTESHKSFNQIERELGYPRNAFSNYRNGVKPSAKRLSEIADYFNVSPEFLLGKSVDRDLKKIQLLFSKLTPERKTFILNLIQQELDTQRVTETGNVCVGVSTFVYKGDDVWQQELPNKQYEIPTEFIPDEFDRVVELCGADFSPEIQNHDLIFIKFKQEIEDESHNTTPGYLLDGRPYARVITADKRIFHIGQENPDFSKFYDASIHHFVKSQIVGIFRASLQISENE